jgi:F420H(2)-dependent quinone reductase
MSTLSPPERLFLRVLALHDTIYRKTGGWIGHRVPGAPPSLLLHAVGAKTGQPRNRYNGYRSKTSRPMPIFALTAS